MSRFKNAKFYNVLLNLSCQLLCLKIAKNMTQKSDHIHYGLINDEQGQTVLRVLYWFIGGPCPPLSLHVVNFSQNWSCNNKQQTAVKVINQWKCVNCELYFCWRLLSQVEIKHTMTFFLNDFQTSNMLWDRPWPTLTCEYIYLLLYLMTPTTLRRQDLNIDPHDRFNERF